LTKNNLLGKKFLKNSKEQKTCHVPKKEREKKLKLLKGNRLI